MNEKHDTIEMIYGGSLIGLFLFFPTIILLGMVNGWDTTLNIHPLPLMLLFILTSIGLGLFTVFSLSRILSDASLSEWELKRLGSDCRDD